MNFRLEHIGLPAQEPEKLAKWYLSVFDGKLIFEGNKESPAYFVGVWGATLEIYPSKGSVAETRDNGVAGFRHLALRVGNIEQARQALEARGVVFGEPIKPAGGGGRVLFFGDGEGNLLHLVEREAGTLFL